MNSLSANPTKWSDTFKQFVGNLPMNCFSVFDHFVGLALKGLRGLTCYAILFVIFLELQVVVDQDTDQDNWSNGSESYLKKFEKNS